MLENMRKAYKSQAEGFLLTSQVASSIICYRAQEKIVLLLLWRNWLHVGSIKPDEASARKLNWQISWCTHDALYFIIILYLSVCMHTMIDWFSGLYFIIGPPNSKLCLNWNLLLPFEPRDIFKKYATNLIFLVCNTQY